VQSHGRLEEERWELGPRALPAKGEGTANAESHDDRAVASGANAGEYLNRLHQEHGCTVGEDEVDPGAGKLTCRSGVLKCPRQRRWKHAGLDIRPSPARAQEGGQQGADGEAAVVSTGSSVPKGAEGAVEVPQQQSGLLHVQGVGELLHGEDKAIPIDGL
jgi:hypothetical protein